jgi:hypothetical protein
MLTNQFRAPGVTVNTPSEQFQYLVHILVAGLSQVTIKAVARGAQEATALPATINPTLSILDISIHSS